MIEGVIKPEKVWETEEAEKIGKEDVAPFFPEWTHYLGKAWKSRKFKVTALTHRKNPIYYNWLANSFEGSVVSLPFQEAYFYEVAQRLVPGLVTDVHIPTAFGWHGGVIYQVKKRRPRDEGYQKNVLAAALAATPGIRLVIAVDEDVDIYNAEDVLWAIESRADPDDFLRGPKRSRGTAAQPTETAGEITAGTFGGGLGIDATVPFLQKGRFERAHYSVDKIDLKKWFPENTINAIVARQCEYAKSLARWGR